MITVREKILRIPVLFGWVKLNDKDVFVSLNYQKSIESNKVYFDIAYCATKAMNGIFLKTIQYNKKRFLHSKLNERK